MNKEVVRNKVIGVDQEQDPQLSGKGRCIGIAKQGLQLNTTIRIWGSEIVNSTAIQISKLMVDLYVIMVLGVSVDMENRSLQCLNSVIIQVEQLQLMTYFLNGHALWTSSCSCGSLRPSWCMQLKKVTYSAACYIFYMRQYNACIFCKTMILMAHVQQASRSCLGESLCKLVFLCCIYPVGNSCLHVIPSTWALFESSPEFFSTSLQVVTITLTSVKQSLSWIDALCHFGKQSQSPVHYYSSSQSLMKTQLQDRYQQNPT